MHLKFQLLFLLLTLMSIFPAHADFAEPDFAFPQTVIHDADAALARADALAGDSASLVRLRALEELCVAASAVVPDSVYTIPARIAAQAAKPNNSASGRAMLLALEGAVLDDIYSAGQWDIDRVDAPLTPLPGKVSLWSRDQFRTRTYELFDSALAIGAATPLAEYRPALAGDDTALSYITTVGGFIRSLAIDNARTFGDDARERRLLDDALAATPEGSPEHVYWLYVANQNDPKGMLAAYEANSSREDARLLLYGLSHNYAEVDEDENGDDAPLVGATQRRLIALLRQSLEQFPSWPGNDNLRNSLAALTRPRCETSVASLAAPGQKLTFTVRYAFAATVRLTAYRIPDNYTCNGYEDLERQPVAAAVVVPISGEVGSSPVELTLGDTGHYIIAANVDGTVNGSTAEVTVTPVIPMSVSCGGVHYAVTANARTGAPAGGIAVDRRVRAFRAGTTRDYRLGKTDSKGLLAFDVPEEERASQSLVFTVDGHRYDFDGVFGVSHYEPNRPYRRRDAVVMTDRALYRPGDSLGYAVVAYSAEGADAAVMADKTLTVTFYDANGDSIASSTGRTDRLGRLDGTFRVPTGRLTGNYGLRVAYDGSDIAYSSVTVSDFKLPTVHIIDLTTARDEPGAGAVTLRGRVMTYSGMPVAAARIEARVSRARRWWNFFAPTEQLGTVEGTTDAEGRFTLVAPATLLTGDPKDFCAALTATTLNAETATATSNFTVGKPLVLGGDIPSKINAAGTPTVKIQAFDASGEAQSVALSWWLAAKDGSKVLDGTATSGSTFDLPLSGVPAGYYSLNAVTAEAALADTTVIKASVAVYNTATDAVPDARSPYFVPDGAVSRRDGKVKVLVGICKPAATVYLALKSDKKLLTIKPFTLRRGFHTLSVDAPDSAEGLGVELLAVYELSSFTDALHVPAPEVPALRITAESFRDRLVPGDRETWRLHIGRADAAAIGAGMIATMFNGALQALEPYATPTAPVFRAPQAYLRCATVNNTPAYLMSVVQPTRITENWGIEVPQWKYIGQMLLAGVNGLMEPRMYKSRTLASGAAMYDYAEEAAAPTEAAYDSDGGEVGGKSAAESAAGPDVKYRDGEVLQAFFMPRLTADAEGNVTIEFTVPDANGTWALRAFGWTDAMAAGAYSGEAVASKPVMVQPNLPRFLRQGDTVRLGATVYNNTDSAATVTTTVEIFNPSDGSVVTAQTFVDRIEGGASAIVNVEAAAPTDAAAVGYRVKAVAGRYGDGEQSAIPVLPSEGTVVESTEFYLNPTQEPYELTLPVQPQTSYTLQYVSNPVWTVVKALRGVSATGSNTSTAIVGRLFSTLAAARIASQCPALADAYRQWADNPSDSALVSMLSRNADLKTLLLEQTPWVQAAASQSDRMAELGRIFDREALTAAMTKNTEALANLAGASGGFAWGPWANGESEWATRTVLTTLGLANSLDMLGGRPELTELARRAYIWLQGEATKPLRPETDIDFALISSLFPTFERSEAGQALLTRTVAKVAADWRRCGTTEKAYSVLILKANGKGSVASRIVESLMQFGVVRPGQGMCFPSVDDIRSYATIIQAFAEMGAPRATLDAMRQWVTLQAQAADDLGAYNPDYVIAAVMLTGSDWTTAPQAFGLSVDGEPLGSSALERATGYTVCRLAPSGSTMRIVVQPNGATPSYGSVTAVGRRTMATVEARPGRDVSIAKRFLVSRGGEWVATDSFALGERVRVQLIVEAGRDMEYVAITDSRAAALEPVDQLPGFVWDGNIGFYRENGDSETRLFLGWLPAGTYHITYDMTANNCGRFASGIATLQSQYAPELTAHSGGTTVTVEP